MSYQVLARKLRPSKFSEVVGQDHICKSLINSIKRKKIASAYLFTGTRGVGKTTIARLFTKAIRCENLSPEAEPCNECNGCLDVMNGSSMNIIEIDGASNNSVEDVRNLISNVSFLPTFGNYKIYIIDEVHMLSTSAFNALLKTLEEPPKHVIFIFATTEPEKLLETVISRCQRYDFNRASEEDLLSFINDIEKREGITFLGNTKEKISEFANGSMRDCLSILDRILCYSDDGSINDTTISQALGIPPKTSIASLVTNIIDGGENQVISIYRDLVGNNISLENIISETLKELFEVSKSSNRMSEVFWLYELIAKDSQWALKSIAPELSFEMVLRKASLRNTFFKKTKVEEKKTEKKKEKSWDDFLKYVEEKSVVMMSNLEQGNLVNQLDMSGDFLKIDLGFKAESKLFFDHLNTKDKQEIIKDYLSSYFEVGLENIDFTILMIGDEGFKSKAEIKKEIEIQNNENISTEIRNHEMIKCAEKLFDTKVDKVVVNKK